jgi:predicted metal-dependent enzyme (double-stranded beta helix superfamily)
MHESLTRFIEQARNVVAELTEAPDRVTAIAPLMHRLIAESNAFLSEEHFRSDPTHYARNAIYICPSGDLSLFSLVWLPGQWTPVHDHGSWGVVGVVRGMLEERAYMSGGSQITGDSGIQLKRGGTTLLNPAAISSFVPNPDHIHMTGVPGERQTCVSMHLYGRNMDSFHIYDVGAGTRRLIDVPHYEVRE